MRETLFLGLGLDYRWPLALLCTYHVLTWIISFQPMAGSPQELALIVSSGVGQPSGKIPNRCLAKASQRRRKCGEDYSALPQNLHLGSSTKLITCRCQHSVSCSFSSLIIAYDLDLSPEVIHLPLQRPGPEIEALDCRRPGSTLQSLLCPLYIQPCIFFLTNWSGKPTTFPGSKKSMLSLPGQVSLPPHCPPTPECSWPSPAQFVIIQPRPTRPLHARVAIRIPNT